MARYVDPLVENVRELVGHRKFHSSDKVEVIDRELKTAKAQAPETIPYHLASSPKHADHFLLMYLPSRKRVLREYIKVSPVGFQYRKESFGSVEALLRHFKKHWKQPQGATAHSVGAARTGGCGLEGDGGSHGDVFSGGSACDPYAGFGIS